MRNPVATRYLLRSARWVMSFITYALVALAYAGLDTGTAYAHHSFALFDSANTITVSGTVRTFEWTNPHDWLWVDVMNHDGTQTSWGFESAAPGELVRLAGW